MGSAPSDGAPGVVSARLPFRFVAGSSWRIAPDADSAYIPGMWIRLLLAFTLVPILELWLLLRIGAWLGAVPTIGLVILTGVAGASLARREGIHAWAAVQAELAAGRLPGRKLLEAVLVLVAGIVLVTPGVITDAVGLLLLIRPLRESLTRRLEERYRRRLETPPEDPPSGGRIIEI